MQTRVRIGIILTIIGLFPLKMQAQIQFNKLQDALEYAKSNAPSLQIDQYYLEKAQHQSVQARSIFLPQIKAFGNFDNYFSLPVQLIPAEFIGGPAGEFREVQFGTQFQLTYGLEATIPLLSLQAWQRNKIEAESVKSTRYKNQSKKGKLKEEIARAYYFSLLSAEALAITLENYKNNELLWKLAQSKLDNGLIETIEYNRIKGLYLESKQRYRDNEQTFNKNLAGLKLLTGIPIQDELVLPKFENEIKEISSYELITQPETYFYQSKLAQAELELKQQRLRYLPEVFAFARYSQNAQRNELNFANNQFPWFTIGVIGIKSEWILFSGFSRNSTLRIGDKQVQIALLELNEQKQRENKEWNELVANYKNAKDAMPYYLELWQLYQENYQIATHKFNLGHYSTDQLLQIYSELLNSQQQYLSKQADFYIYYSALEIKNEYSNYEN